MHYSKLFVLIIRVIYFFWSHPGAQVCRPGVSDITKPCIHTQFGNKYDSTIVLLSRRSPYVPDRINLSKKKKKKIKARWCLLKDQKADTHFSIMLPGIHFSISRRLLWNECRKIIYIIKHGNFMLKSRCLALKYQDLLDARPLSELQP